MIFASAANSIFGRSTSWKKIPRTRHDFQSEAATIPPNFSSGDAQAIVRMKRRKAARPTDERRRIDFCDARNFSS
jgi:hypothetical protein